MLSVALQTTCVHPAHCLPDALLESSTLGAVLRPVAWLRAWHTMPAGLTVPFERKAEIYAICCEYDVIILEDDPYWYLQFGRGASLWLIAYRLPDMILHIPF